MIHNSIFYRVVTACSIIAICISLTGCTNNEPGSQPSSSPEIGTNLAPNDVDEATQLSGKFLGFLQSIVYHYELGLTDEEFLISKEIFTDTGNIHRFSISMIVDSPNMEDVLERYSEDIEITYQKTGETRGTIQGYISYEILPIFARDEAILQVVPINKIGLE